MSEHAIPEDLKAQHELNKKWLALPVSKRPRSTNGVESILRSDCVWMAERIAKAEAERDALRGGKFSDRDYAAMKSRAELAEAALARMQGPVTDAENFHFEDDEVLNAIGDASERLKDGVRRMLYAKTTG